MNTIGERITFLRDNMELTQTELAEKIGITPMTLAKYTKDLNEPRSSTIIKLAQVLNTTADYILGLCSEYSDSNVNSNSLNRKREQDLLFNFRKLSEEDKIRVEERILTLLEK